MANAVHEQSRLLLALGDAPGARRAAEGALARFDALLAVDRLNMDWLGQAALARLTLGEALLAQGRRDSARDAWRHAESDVNRLLADGAVGTSRRLLLQGGLIRLRLALTEPWPNQRQTLQDYLDDVRQIEASTQALGADQVLLIARAEVALSDLLEPLDRAAADARRRSAAGRLREAANQGDTAAMQLLAQALWRLGKDTDARALERRLVLSGYRHPDLADLQARLASGEGAAGHHHQ
jgi:tetratricopeptide (TPR) repeat protein